MSNKKHLVFVYGTLKKGYGNHRLLTGAEFVGNFATAPDYKIYCNGAYPYMVEVGAGKGVPVEGEIYRISDEEQQRCDRLEGHPHMYLRKSIPIMHKIEENVQDLIPTTIEGVEAYIYQHSVRGSRECNTCWPKDREILETAV